MIGETMICPKCGHMANHDSYFGAMVCRQCGWMRYDKPTNADRIRSMSDEELAAWICLPDCEANRYETCITITTEKTFDVPYGRKTDPLHDVLDWLRQPAGEAHDGQTI